MKRSAQKLHTTVQKPRKSKPDLRVASRNFPPYPEGSTFNPWTLREETRKGLTYYRIRRWIGMPGREPYHESYDVSKYRHIRDDRRRLEDLVLTLNDRLPEAERAKEKAAIRHAWINEDIIREFLIEVRGDNTVDNKAKDLENYLRVYFLQWFSNCLNVTDMNRWFRYQRIWGYALLNKLTSIEWTSAAPCPDHLKGKGPENLEVLRLWAPGHPVSYHTVKSIVQNANRFMTFLSIHYSEKMDTFLAFNPLSPAQLKHLKAETDIRTNKRKWFIPDSDWEIIQSAMVNKDDSGKQPFLRLKGPTQLCYMFGLRRTESLGVNLVDVTPEEGLTVERQMVKWLKNELPEYGLTKGRAARTVEYKMVPEAKGPSITYKTIQQTLECPITPQQMSKDWKKLMGELGFPYGLHDIRRTWVTRCFRNKDIAIDRIRQNAGHVEIQTTEKYRLDEKKLLKKSWVPKDDLADDEE